MQKLIFLIKKNKLLKNSTNKLNNIKKRTLFLTKSTNFETKENSNLFWNCSFDKGRLKSFVSWFLNTYGEYKTIELLEQLKNLGFGYATKAGVSLGIDDLKIPSQKFELINQAESKIFKGIEKYKKGQITGIERLQQLIDVWNQTSEFLKQEVIRNFEATDLFNPVYMMAFSGARGNVSQVRQLVGMRGLMSDPQGNIIDFPIQSNFREGLTLTEYIISTYGARKGIVDTALRTATAGYLTRRLVDVAQHVMISQFDCGTTRGIFLFDMKEGAKTIYSFQNRLIGRVLANDIQYSNKTTKIEKRSIIRSNILAYRNQEISASLAASIAKITKKAFVRSPLTCETRKLVCQLCYGWSLASSKLVSLGEAVGVIAAQSIGEPGTQLTMRTFHTGGVFSGGLTNQIIAPYDGYIEYLDTIPGTCIRTPQGDIGFLTKSPGSFFIKEPQNLYSKKKQLSLLLEVYKIPAYAILFSRHKEQVFKKQIVAQFSSVAQQQTQRGNAEQTIYAELEGQIAFFQIDLLEQKNEKLFEDIVLKAIDWSKIWILSGKIYYDPLGLNSFGINGDFFNRNTTFQKIYWHNLNSCFLDIPLKPQKKKNCISNFCIKRFSLTENLNSNMKFSIFPFFHSNLRGGSKQNLNRLEQKEDISNILILDSFKFNKETLTKINNKIPKNFYIKGFKKKIILNSFLKFYYHMNFKKENITYSNSKNFQMKKKNKLSYFFLMNTFVFDRKIKKGSKKNIRKVQKKFEILSKSKIVFSKFYKNNNARFLALNLSKSDDKYSRFEKIIKNNYFKDLKNLSFYSKSNVIKNPYIFGLSMNECFTTREIENHLKKLFFKIQKKKKIAKKICSRSFLFLLNFKEIDNKNSSRLLILAKVLKLDPYSPYIYPFRTFARFFIFKKINRIDFFSYYIKKSFKGSISKKKKKFTLIVKSNKTKQKNIKKLMNPFILKKSIPNFLKKKKVMRFFSAMLGSKFLDLQILKKEDLIFEKTKKLNTRKLESLISSTSHLKSLFLSNAINKSYFYLDKKVKRPNKRNSKINDVYKRKPILTFPVNKISFKKLSYIFSSTSHFKSKNFSKMTYSPLGFRSFSPRISYQTNLSNTRFERTSEKEQKQKEAKEYDGFPFALEIKSKESKSSIMVPYIKNKKTYKKCDLILSYFPLTNFYNKPIDASNINDPGKNYQKLSLGNTLNFSPFSNKAFRWFPSDSQTKTNGIYIWSQNFLLNFLLLEKSRETEMKNSILNGENPDFYINNYYFFQKKRWINVDGLFKKKSLKIVEFRNSINKFYFNFKNNVKNKSQKILNLKFENKESYLTFYNNKKRLNNKLQINENLEKKPYNFKFRYDLTFNQKLKIFVTKKYVKKIDFFYSLPNNLRFSKFSVYKKDFYYIPQENYRLNIWNFKENNFDNIFSSKFYLSNRQGFKKELPSEISGLTRIYTKKNKKPTLLERFRHLKINEDSKEITKIKNYKISNKLDLNFSKNSKVINKNHKDSISYMKIKKASIGLDRNIRNKMTHNLNSRIFKAQKNKKLQKNLNKSLFKCSNFYKNYDFNDHFMLKIKEKIFIAQLRNQSLFFSSIPFISLDSFNFLMQFKKNNTFTSCFDLSKIRVDKEKNRFTEKIEAKRKFVQKIDSILKKKTKQKQKSIIKAKSFICSCQVEKIKKPGWVYFLLDSTLNSFPAIKKETNFKKFEKFKIKNFLFFKILHQKFVDAGKKIIHDVCFEQNKIYIENVTLSKKFKNQKININKIYTNTNCRFFNGKLSSIMFNEKNNSIDLFESINNLEPNLENNNFALLLRPIIHKTLPNPQLFKKELCNNKKNSYNSYSILFYKDFHSNLLNLQHCQKKSLSKFPSVDFQIRQISHNINFFNLSKKLKSKKIQFSKKFKKNVKTSKTKFQSNTIKSKIHNKKNWNLFTTSYNKKQSSEFQKKSFNNKMISFYIKRYSSYNTNLSFSNIFYSAYKTHSFSLELTNTKPLGFDFGFNIPTIMLKPSYSNIIKQQNLNFLKKKISFSKKQNNLSLIYSLMKKNKIRKLWISTSFQNLPLNSYNNNNFLKKYRVSSKNLQKNFNPFFSFFYLYPFQFIEWSFFCKDDYLANNIFSSNLTINNSKNCFFPNSLKYSKRIIKSNLVDPFPFNSSNNNRGAKKNERTKFSNRSQKSEKSGLNMKSPNFQNTIFNSKKTSIINRNLYQMQPLSFTFPLIKNSFLLYKAYNKILANRVYASTSFLSPFEGELLTENNNNKWWNQYAETDLNHKKFNIKYYIFLTKKDIFSISFNLNSKNKYMQQNKKINVNEYLSLFSSFYSNSVLLFNTNIKQQTQTKLFDKLKSSLVNFSNNIEFLNTYYRIHNKKKYNILNFVTKYQNKIYKLKGLSIGKVSENKLLNLQLGKFLLRGDSLSFDQKIDQTGQIIHLNSKKITLRYAQPFLISPKGILHVQQGDYIYRNAPILTLPFETLTTGDIVQGIPKVEQYLEARTTQNGRFFLYSLPVLQKAIFERYRTKLPLEQAVSQSFLKIQQIIVDGVQRVYRSQGVSIAEKHLEVIVKQMTSKVQIIHGGQTGFFPGELVDLEIVENINKFLMVKIRYEPIVLGITRASLEVESFLSAASFQQTTKILAKASLSKKKDYLKGLKENILVGNLIPSGTGFMNSYSF